MLTLEELRSTEVHFGTAKEALAQAEKRLGDALDVKKTVEQKATVLFGAYVTLSIALFGLATTMARDGTFAKLAWPFFIAGAVLVIGGVMFAHVFRSANYGNMGSEPSMWLQAGRIDGGEQELARMLAYLAYHHAARIEASYASNADKSWYLHTGMIIGLVAAAALALGVPLTYVAYAIRP
jgi:hypothetical protein